MVAGHATCESPNVPQVAIMSYDWRVARDCRWVAE
jgi:hypothetical protein